MPELSSPPGRANARRASPLLIAVGPLLAALLALTGCTTRFVPGDPHDATVDAAQGMDVSELRDSAATRDVWIGRDGAADAAARDGGATDAAPADAAPADAAPTVDAGCPQGTKWCGGACVSVDSPATGCAAPSCDPCLYDHGAALCVSGHCALGPCENGWGNCDGDASNGCEADFQNDPAHCGSCPNACSTPHATVECQGGGCVTTGCQSGYADCDHDMSTNGCEIYTRSDDDNCGACGRVCLTGFHCNNTMCRCSSNSQCDPNGVGECDGYYQLCECPAGSSVWCGGPCNANGHGCLPL